MLGMETWKWEGKGFIYTVKYACRVAPEVLLSIPLFLVFIPSLVTYARLYRDEEKIKNSRFRTRYVVLRDDDPNVKKIVYIDADTKITGKGEQK